MNMPSPYFKTKTTLLKSSYCCLHHKKISLSKGEEMSIASILYKIEILRKFYSAYNKLNFRISDNKNDTGNSGIWTQIAGTKVMIAIHYTTDTFLYSGNSYNYKITTIDIEFAFSYLTHICVGISNFSFVNKHLSRVKKMQFIYLRHEFM